ncbi:MAG: DUF2169 domain-containing protein [Polyangiaceae bacterium]
MIGGFAAAPVVTATGVAVPQGSGSCAAAARVWRHRRRRLVTAIGKATFELGALAGSTAASLVRVAPVALVHDDRHHRDHPIASLAHHSDLALLVPDPELLVVGSAYARGRNAVRVALTVSREGRLVLSKQLDVTGDRTARPNSGLPEPQPFDAMPLVYERAYGGVLCRENPVGLGMDRDQDGGLRLPNIFYAGQGPLVPPPAGGDPAGFGPIASIWGIRAKRRGSLSVDNATYATHVDLPDDFDETYFQAAPLDQRLQELEAGDVIGLTGMHPTEPRVELTIPDLGARALVKGASPSSQLISLRLDTVFIDLDRNRVELTFRGAAVLSEADVPRVDVAVAIDEPSKLTSAALENALAALPQAQPNRERPLPAPTIGKGGTVVLEATPQAALPPFAPPPPAPPPPAPPPPAPPSPGGFAARREHTAILEPNADPQSLPFHRAGAAQQGGARAAQPPPGSPFVGAEPLRRVVVRVEEQETTDLAHLPFEPPRKAPPVIAQTALPVDDEPIEEAPEPVRVPPPDLAPEAQEAPPPKPAGSPWRVDEAPAAAAPKPPPAPAPTKVDLRKQMYRKLKK